jgi:hypothetical protein
MPLPRSANVRARHLRNHDRHVNTYPALHYPNICVLDGGFSDFFSGFGGKDCTGTYVEMKDKAFDRECKLYDGLLQQKNAHKLRRWNSESVVNLSVKKFPGFGR